MRATQQALAQDSVRDEAYDIPYSTLHVNIVPNQCVLDFEIRTLPGNDGRTLLDNVRTRFAHCSDAAPPVIEEVSAYPGLDTHAASDAVRLLEALPDATAKQKVAFGTEGGLFSTRLSIPTVVCGPGGIEVAHKPDEYVALEQLKACDVFLARMIDSLT
ncbi:protein of unknown function (plasmid) [Caballeronia sp. S22]